VEKKSHGFLTTPPQGKRATVMLTRARELLLIIADVASLLQAERNQNARYKDRHPEEETPPEFYRLYFEQVKEFKGAFVKVDPARLDDAVKEVTGLLF
jgi:hypothetical protein